MSRYKVRHPGRGGKYPFHKLRTTNPKEYWRLRWQEYKETIDRSELWKKRWREQHHTGISGVNAYRARRHRKDYCEVCGSIENLCAHHRNLKQNDNRAENILTVCVECHNRIHNELRKKMSV